jgi:dihydroorotate dehydrogenase
MPWARVSLALYRLARPLLFRFDPERIHHLTLRGLRGAGERLPGRLVLRVAGGAAPQAKAVQVAGMDFRNRIGVGAGFDKDGVGLLGWAALGLGFVEVGTVTPLAQPGNPRPRLFRLATDEALVNRMGFNNAGAATLARHVMLARERLPGGFRVGVNIGRNRSVPNSDAVGDYLAVHRLVAPVADYLVLNVSSPNTPGLRDLQDLRSLEALLTAVDASAHELDCQRPIFVKLAPDLADDHVLAIARFACDSPAAGLVLSNTTTRREGLSARGSVQQERGGLSGRPLLSRTLALVASVRDAVGSRLALIASGGIGSGADASAAMAAGADLVQLWTGLVYRGPGLIGEAVEATDAMQPVTARRQDPS